MGIVTLDGIMEGRLSVVVGDVHLGMAVLHQLHQDLPVTLAAGQVQGRAALLILRAVGAAAGRAREVSGRGMRWAGAEKPKCGIGKWARSSRALMSCSSWLVQTQG